MVPLVLTRSLVLTVLNVLPGGRPTTGLPSLLDGPKKCAGTDVLLYGSMILAPRRVGGRSPWLLNGAILWMDDILHPFETMGNHCLLVFTGESNHSMVSQVMQDFVHPEYDRLCSAAGSPGNFSCGKPEHMCAYNAPRCPTP